MAEAEQQQDTSKTLVAFVVGLLIGGMLVWAFSGPSVDAPETDATNQTAEETTTEETTTDTSEESASEEETAPETPTMEVGDGAVEVSDQPAGLSVTLERATYPVEEGWIGVR